MSSAAGFISSLQAPIECAQGKSILTICTQIKYPCVLEDLD